MTSNFQVVETSGTYCSTLDRYQRFDHRHYYGDGIRIVSTAFDIVDAIDVAWMQIDLNRWFDQPSDQIKLYQHYQKLRELNHPNIVKIKELWINNSNNTLNTISDLVYSNSLYKYYNSKRKPNMKAVKSISQQLLSMLSYIHEKGMIHSSLSDGVFIEGRTGKIFITDFVNLDEYDSFPDTRSLSGYRDIAYMPPEQFNQHKSCPMMDIYAFGIIILKLITSQYPYEQCKTVLII